MGWTVKSDGFIVPEGLGILGVDKDEDSEEYKTAQRQFKRVLIDGGTPIISSDDSAKYGSNGFGDGQFIKFYCENTPDDSLKKAIQPYYKSHLLPKIKEAVSSYISAKYAPDGITADERVLIDGLERYQAKLETDDDDIKRAIRKIGELTSSNVDRYFFLADVMDLPPEAAELIRTEIINVFFKEQFEGPSGANGTISSAEALELEQKQQLNLATGKGDAAEDDGGLFGLFPNIPSLSDMTGLFERSSTTIGLDDLSDDQLTTVRQCILSSDLMNERAVAPNSTSWSQTYVNNWMTGHPSGSYQGRTIPFDGRIIPLTTRNTYNPSTLINMCTVSTKTKSYVADEDALSPEMYYKLYWVYETKEGLKEIEIFLSSATDDYKLKEAFDFNEVVSYDRAKQIKDGLRNGLGYAITNVEVILKGTNPSTARKDVKANITIELDNLQSIDAICAYTKDPSAGKDGYSELKIYDLITLPTTQTVETRKSAGGGIYRDEFHPDYSRIRLKVWSLEGEWGADNVESALIYDLCCIDHKLDRKDDGAGRTKLTINYAGYFESAMDISSMDALATSKIIEERYKRRRENNKYILDNNCDDATRRKITSTQAEYDRLEALHNIKTGTIVRELFKRGCIFGYDYSKDYVAKKVVNGSLPPLENYLTKANWLGSITIKPGTSGGLADMLSSGWESIKGLFGGDGADAEMNEEGDVDVQDQGGGYPYHGFFLGDLMYVILDCLYKDGTSTHHEWAKNMNLRFMVTSIPVPDPQDLSKTKLISPLAIPIDLRFFTTWFHDTITKSGKTSYPAGVFIKDLLERLINAVIYDTCFANLLPEEKPPQLRVGFFTDHTTDGFYSTGGGSFFDPGSPSILMRSNPKLGVDHAYNYCVIYIQNPSTQRQAKAKRLVEDPYTLTMYYGNNRKTANYIADVNFKKTSMPFIREARHAQTDFGNLSLLSNVYDLSFAVKSPKAITTIYPGNIINFILTDWAPDIEWEQGDPLNESDPHKRGTKANILGFGGYYTVKSVTYSLTLNVWNDFKVSVDCVFAGNDAESSLRLKKEGDKPAKEKSKKCEAKYNEIVEKIKVYAEEHNLNANVGSKEYGSGSGEETNANDSEKSEQKQTEGAERIKEDKTNEDGE